MLCHLTINCQQNTGIYACEGEKIHAYFFLLMHALSPYKIRQGCSRWFIAFPCFGGFHFQPLIWQHQMFIHRPGCPLMPIGCMVYQCLILFLAIAESPSAVDFSASSKKNKVSSLCIFRISQSPPPRRAAEGNGNEGLVLSPRQPLSSGRL